MNQGVQVPIAAGRRVNRGAILANAAAFSPLGPAARQRIAQNARPVRIARGEPLDDGANLVVLGTGHASCVIEGAPGRERVYAILGPGDTYGIETLFARPRSRVNARMLTEGVVLRLPAESLLEALTQYPALVRALLGELSKNVLDLTRQLESQSVQCARERVSAYLLHLTQDAASRPQDVLLPAPKRIVASLLDLTKESFSRVLHELVENGFIEVQRRAVRILSPDALARICSAARGCGDCAYCPRGGAFPA